MRKVVFLALAFSIPVLIFINVYQVYTFHLTQASVELLEVRQKEYFEMNKEILANIAIYKSLDRLEDSAINSFGLQKLKASQIIHVRLTNAKGAAGD